MSYHRALGMPLWTGAVIGANHIDYVADPYARVTPMHPLHPRYRRYPVGQYESDVQQLGESGDGLGGILAVL